MTILFAAPDMDAAQWRARLAALLPNHPFVLLGEPLDPTSVRYVLSWRHPPGALNGMPNLEVIFSLGRASTTCLSIRPCRMRRSCGSSIRTSATG